MKQKNVILMVVAVGCGLVAAFLTSQMSAKGQVEQVQVLVAAKDLPVGTLITREDLDKMVKTKTVPKEGLPPTIVINREELLDKKLTRPVRTDETFNPSDLTKGGVVTLPDGYDMVSLQVGVANAAAGFVGPGSRVNVNATVRSGNKTLAFPLLVNMLVVAVDTNTVGSKEGTYPSMNTVSFAVREKEALLLSLAKSRGCTIELMLRHPNKSNESDKSYNMESVLAMLSDPDNQIGVRPSDGGGDKPVPPTPPKPEPKIETPPAPPTPPAPMPPVVETRKVLIAVKEIAPNTDVTKDLIAEAFELKELPKDLAVDALGDLTDALGQQFKTGVAKGQWVTPTMIGFAPKPVPQDKVEIKPEVKPEPAPKEVPPPPVVVKKRTHDVAVHTSNGTVIHRFEEVKPGVWKKIAELTPEQASKDEAPETPKADPESKKRD
ncbi:Flp pilus assembly protein CpaB [Frigoriglobus tundricola]|uniref:SAF domain-containing protein n=1 Tax=Frigoriglobus tundricola TaxID=2774151 RepID=A0A6M5YL01_9BACT|nr:Flp pilus assembly protein CpaB [Frigoriglobus tundricola]QJW93963.1 hypothetical protein FTUN_1480 [Frigoriglobus tundricola]